MYFSSLIIPTTILASQWLISTVNALPLTNTNMQTVFSHQQNTNLYESEEQWYQSQEYGIFSTIVDYYENMVDTTLNSESEELLLNLIHLPKSTLNNVLSSQAELLGFNSISEKQISKMPSIIGKHIQIMNNNIYSSIEPVIKLHWRSIWDPKIIKANDEEETLSFLSTFNGIVAKRLMDEMDNFDLLDKIKDDLVQVSSTNEDAIGEKKQTNSLLSICEWMKTQVVKLVATKTQTSSDNTVAATPDLLEVDFLRQHLSDIRTSLLMELHVQFMDFFAKIQADIIDQLAIYYDDHY
ncbi:MAG: hypothetical protein EXX96DRAFT_562283 [Benjaminiella poitrasii]|nr:MAG: hypothetical protein EXX96DRAFT_562283 [Benjaminiella poitrasii]